MRVAAPFAGTLHAAVGATRRRRVAVGAPVFALEQRNEVRRAPAGASSSCRPREARLANLKHRQAPARKCETVAEQLRQAMAARELVRGEPASGRSSCARAASSAPPRSTTRAPQLERDEAQVASLQAQVATTKLPARARRDPRGRSRRARGARGRWRRPTGGSGSARSPRRPRGSSTTRTTSSATGCRRAARWRAVLPPAQRRACASSFRRPRSAPCKRGAVGRRSPATAAARRSRRRSTFVVRSRRVHAARALHDASIRAKLVYLVEARPAPADAREAASRTAGRRHARGNAARAPRA